MVSLRAKVTNKGYHLYLDYYYKGKRDFEFLGMYTSKNYLVKKPPRITSVGDRETLLLANQILVQKRYEFYQNGYKFAKAKADDISLIDYMMKISLSKKNNRSYLTAVSAIKRYKKNPMLGDITPQFLKDVQAYLVSEELNYSSIFIYMSRIKETLSMALKEDLILSNPFDKIDIVKAESAQKDYLLISEIKLLANTPCLDDSLKKAFLFSCFTGLRVSDLRKLLWSEIKELNGLKVMEIITQKTNKKLLLPLSLSAVEILASLTPNQEPNTHVFAFSVVPTTATTILQKWVKKAGIEKHITFHCARTTFAALCIDAGIDIYTLSKMLTHSSVKTTEIYSRLDVSKARESIDKLPQI